MSGASDLAMLGRVMGGLIVVLVLVGLAAKLVRRTRGTNGDSGLRIVERIGLSREANLAVIEVASRKLLLGVTAQGVTMLADLDDAGRRDQHRISATPIPQAPSSDDRELTAMTGPGTQQLSTDAADTSTAGAADRLLEQREFGDPDGYQPDNTDENPADEPDGDHPTPLPTGIPVDEYPDLASALRAAGRTAGTAAGTSQTPVPAQGAPRTRAEARARRAGSSAASVTHTENRVRESIPTQRETPNEASARAVAAPKPAAGSPTPSASTSGSAAPVPSKPSNPSKPSSATSTPPTRTQASGSVLSPKTWRQGIEALRELTIRRG
jgi:flagellar biogenesis protein FliO